MGSSPTRETMLTLYDIETDLFYPHTTIDVRTKMSSYFAEKPRMDLADILGDKIDPRLLWGA